MPVSPTTLLVSMARPVPLSSRRAGRSAEAAAASSGRSGQSDGAGRHVRGGRADVGTTEAEASGREGRGRHTGRAEIAGSGV